MLTVISYCECVWKVSELKKITIYASFLCVNKRKITEWKRNDRWVVGTGTNAIAGKYDLSVYNLWT